MTLTILPPELLTTPSSSAGGSKKQFDSKEFLANKLGDGESEQFRLLGHYESGHSSYIFRCPVEEQGPNGLKFAGYDYSTDSNFPNAARQTDWSTSERKKIEGEFVRGKRCLSWIAYSITRNRVELLLLEPTALREGITEILQDEDYTWSDDDIAEFTLKIGRTGTGISTTYSVIPKMKKVTQVEIDAFAEVRDTAMVEKLLQGGHPLTGASFSSDTDKDSEF